MILLQQSCVFITTTMHISVSFRLRHCIKYFSNYIIFGSKVDNNEFSLFVLKTIPRQFDLFGSQRTS